MGLYDCLAGLPLVVESGDRVRHERDTSSGFTRVTTEFHLHGEGVTGRGEDVCYDTEDHDAFTDVPPVAGTGGPVDVAGEWTFAEYSAALEEIDLFPGYEPERPAAHHYRRWAFESAGLDLALRQAGESLGSVLGREYDPVRFVVSSRLPDGEPDRVLDVADAYPGTEFKLDPTDEWTDGAFERLAATGAVRVLDMKGQYEGTVVDQEPTPELYQRVLERFPDAVIEDPAVTEETRPLLEANADRLSWDAVVEGLEDVRTLPFEPRWCNVKPSRFGTVASLLETLEYCLDRDVQLYGGGQFELGVGRGHIQALASVFYPDGPNDVAPGGYNDPDVPAGLPTSPLAPPADPLGLDGPV
jgi:hypothetical protein